MELQQILGFYHVAQLKSFTRAAEATYRTQSALSQQIKILEQELECILLERVGNTIFGLTAEGEEFFRFSETILNEHDIILDKIKKIKGKNVGKITIASPFNSMAYLLPPYIDQYLRQNKSVTVKLLEMTPFKSLEMVASGEADCAITMRSAASKIFITHNWKISEYTLVVKSSHPLANQANISLEDIAKYPLILPLRNTKSAPRIRLLRKFDKMGLEVQIAMEASGYFMIQKYVKTGLGIGFCLVPSDIVKKGEPGLKLIPIRSFFGFEHIAIVLRKNKYMSKPLQTFLDLLLEHSDTSE